MRRKVVGEQGLEVAVWRWAVLGNSGVQGVSWEEGSSGDGDTPLSLLCVFSLLYVFYHFIHVFKIFLIVFCFFNIVFLTV
mgnify:CR=1 FL=1